MSTPEALSKEGLVSTVQDGQLTAENLSLEVGDGVVRLPPLRQ